jgi:hypothetical protein
LKSQKIFEKLTYNAGIVSVPWRAAMQQVRINLA